MYETVIKSNKQSSSGIFVKADFFQPNCAVLGYRMVAAIRGLKSDFRDACLLIPHL